MNQTVHDELITIRDLQISIQSEGSYFEVVKGVSLSIRANEIVCLVGESGCGKSITALSVMGLLPSDVARVTGGEILYRGQNLLGLNSRDMRRLRSDEISMIFQDPITSLDPMFTIGSLLKEVIRSHRQVSRSEAEKLAVRALEEAQLPDASNRLKSYPHELSGGMRQRVMIALATALNPSVLIADEPTTALDVTVQAQILESLRMRQRESKMGMLLITHDLAVVAAVADRVAVMYSGEIVEEARVNDLFGSPRRWLGLGLAALAVPAAAQALGSGERYFERVATFPVFENTSIDTDTVAEIVAAARDGTLLVYTDGENGAIGLVDITDPAAPTPAGNVPVGGEPTSVAVLGDYALTAVNTSASFTAPSGELAIIDLNARRIVRTLALPGQPDAAASPRGHRAAWQSVRCHRSSPDRPPARLRHRLRADRRTDRAATGSGRQAAGGWRESRSRGKRRRLYQGRRGRAGGVGTDQLSPAQTE
jgi:peptide/nickel transport system ATP-binding protein